MKKLLLIMLFVILLSTGCNANNNETKDEKENIAINDEEFGTSYSEEIQIQTAE